MCGSVWMREWRVALCGHFAVCACVGGDAPGYQGCMRVYGVDGPKH